MTALIKLNEPIVDAMVAKLIAGLPGAIAQINTLDTKDIMLAPVAAVLDYVPTPTLLVNFPTVAVQDGITRVKDDSGTGGTTVSDLQLIVFVLDADQRSLAVKLRRYLQAVLSVAADGRSVGPAWGMTIEEIVPGPTLGRGEDPREWMSYAGVALRMYSETEPGV